MAVKKQPDSEAGTLHEDVIVWFRQFLKHLELFMSETGQQVSEDADLHEYSLAAIRAVKLTLIESGLDEEQILGLFGRVSLEKVKLSPEAEWTPELNKRRFELIDKEIQGMLSNDEQLELAGLTQLVREHVDSDGNMPLEGARILHRRLSGFDTDSMDSQK